MFLFFDAAAHNAQTRFLAPRMFGCHCCSGDATTLGRGQKRRSTTLARTLLAGEPIRIGIHELEEFVESVLPWAAATNLLNPRRDPLQLSAAFVEFPAGLPQRERACLLPRAQAAVRGSKQQVAEGIGRSHGLELEKRKRKLSQSCGNMYPISQWSSSCP